MFTDGIRVIALCTSLYRRARNAGSKTGRAMNQTTPEQDLKGAICRALSEMLPATAEEIAETLGLAPGTVSAGLDQLMRRHRIMFNPLTKRYSLPKIRPGAGLAA